MIPPHFFMPLAALSINDEARVVDSRLAHFTSASSFTVFGGRQSWFVHVW
jgi:hypothetical protein